MLVVMIYAVAMRIDAVDAVPVAVVGLVRSSEKAVKSKVLDLESIEAACLAGYVSDTALYRPLDEGEIDMETENIPWAERVDLVTVVQGTSDCAVMAAKEDERDTAVQPCQLAYQEAW